MVQLAPVSQTKQTQSKQTRETQFQNISNVTIQRKSLCLLCFKKDKIMEVRRLFALIILKSALTHELHYQGKGSSSHKLSQMHL